MFEQSEAKRVCRADLRSRSSSTSSSEPNEEIQTLLQSRLAQLYGPIPTVIPTKNTKSEVEANVNDKLQEDNEEEEFEFRLFATPTDPNSTNGLKTGKIILANGDDLVKGHGAFLVPQRDLRYYFTGEISSQQHEQFKLASISGDDVRRGLRVRHTGLEVPWRVSVIQLAVSNRQNSKVKDAKAEGQEKKAAERKRKRMGKKMRILHRKQENTRRELLSSEHEKLAMKEAVEREKKTRRNKEKQLKKRAKEKAKKAGLVSAYEADMDMSE